MKKIILTLIGILGFAGTAFALPYYSSQQTLLPFLNISYDLGTTTQSWRDLFVRQICFSLDTCRTTWPTAGSNSGNVATSSAETAGYFPRWASTNGTPATLTGTSAIFQNGNNIGIGTLTPTDVNANARLTVSGNGAQDIIASTTDNTTSTTAILEAYASGSRVFIGAHGANQVATQYGIVSGGWGELGAINSTFGTSNGLMIGTRTTAAPIVFGTNSVERMRILSNGNVGTGTTTPWALFSVHPNALGSGVPEFVIGSSTKTHFVVDGNGNVGIGTTSPLAQLNQYSALPEHRLTTSGDGWWTRLTRTTGDLAKRLNYVINPAGTSYSIQFDGIDDYLNYSSGTRATGTSFTVSMWIKLNTVVSGYATLYTATGNDGIYLVSGKPQWYNGTSANANTTLTTATWYNLIITSDASTLRWYLNGVADGTPSYAATLNAVTNIGGHSANQRFDGKIKDVTVFNVKIPDADIALIAAGSNPVTVPINRYKFNEGTGTTASDSTGNVVMNLTSGPVWSTDVPSANPGAPVAVNSEIAVWQSQDGGVSGEDGIQTFGWKSGRTVVEGLTIPFNVGASEIAAVKLSLSGSTPVFETYGNMAVDTNTLYVDSVNNRVGIGTTSPSTSLDVANNSGSAYITVQNGDQVVANGTKVQIGYTETFYPGIWFGNVTPSSTNYSFLFANGGAILNTGASQFFFRKSNANKWAYGSGFSFGDTFYATDPGNGKMIVETSLGIGTTTPWGSLSVNPNALASGVPEFVVGSTTRTHFLINTAGNVGFGVTTPQSLLSLKNGGAMGWDDGSLSKTFLSIATSTLNGLKISNGSGGTTADILLAGNIFTSTADKTLNSATPTTAFASGVGTLVFPANSLRVGKKFNITGTGYYSTPIGNTATVTITPSIASSTATTISTVTTAIFPASATNFPFNFNMTCTVRAIGASATLVCDGDFLYTTALSGVAKTSNSLSTVGTITFDSTVAETIDVKVNWSAVTTQTATVQEAGVDFMN